MHTYRGTTRQLAARLGAGIGIGSVAVAGFVSPATAVPVQSVDQSACAVSEATLTWGVKERFRSYISGSIANGEWTVSDDMRYETPSFIWETGTGVVSPTVDTGEIDFTGAVHFTGHGGLMTLDLANPKIEFTDAETAYLLLDIGSNDASDDGVNAEQDNLKVAKIDLTERVTADGTSLTIDGAVPLLTADGAAAMNGEYGTYVAGDDLDPILLEATIAGCELGEQTTVPTPEEELPGSGEASAEAGAAAPGGAAEETKIPWLPIGIGVAALLVIGVTGSMLIGGRGKNNPASDSND